MLDLWQYFYVAIHHLTGDEAFFDKLRNTPDHLTKPYFKGDLDTGETIIHLLAKGGCVEVLRKILDFSGKPGIQKSKLVEAILQYDDAGWSPLMSAMKADRNGEIIIKMLLEFLENESTITDVEQILRVPKEVNILDCIELSSI